MISKNSILFYFQLKVLKKQHTNLRRPISNLKFAITLKKKILTK
jgi:hypothetical protein